MNKYQKGQELESEKVANIESSEKSLIKRIGVIIVGFVLINIILWGAQEIYHYSDNKTMENIKTEMADLDIQINTFESMSEKYEVTKREYSNYERMIEDFNKKAEEHNQLAKSSGSRWYIIPIPFGATRKSK